MVRDTSDLEAAACLSLQSRSSYLRLGTRCRDHPDAPRAEGATRYHAIGHCAVGRGFRNGGHLGRILLLETLLFNGRDRAATYQRNRRGVLECLYALQKTLDQAG